MIDDEIPINHGYTFDTVDRSPEAEAARKLLARLRTMQPVSTEQEQPAPDPSEA